MIQVTADVYVETGFRGCNQGFVTTKEGIVMIDTPMRPTEAIKWREEISKRGEVRYLINTEPHLDHFMGNYFFPGVVVSHEETRKVLLSQSVDEILGWVRKNDSPGLSLMDEYQLTIPAITFSDRLTLFSGDHTFELIYLPGHVSGLLGVYIPEERVVFASDCVFFQKKSYLNEALPDQWLKSLKTLAELEVDVIVPGHGDDVCTKKYLQIQAGIIEGWIDVVKTAIKQGLSPEEAESAISCPDPYSLPKSGPMTEPELDRAIIARLYQILGP